VQKSSPGDDFCTQNEKLAMSNDVTTRGAGDEIVVEAHGAVRLVTLNRPDALNAADESLHGEIARIWRELDADADVRAIVLTGSGKAFSAGGDLQLLDRMVHDPALRERIMAEGMEIVRAMTSVRVPIVSAVNGPAVGLGCSLASMSDLVIIEEQAYFSDPHVALGLVAADGGALTWPLLTSLLRAKEFILLGDRLPAAEAVALGLANRVVPTGTSMTVALELAERLAALPPQAVIATKSVLNDALRRAVATVLEGAIAAETASFDEAAFQANLGRMLRR
jgi:enoyl-CoA hydratase